MNQNVKILRLPEVKSVTGLSRSTIYEKMEEGSFPKQIKLSERSVGWIESEVQDWVKSRIQKARTDEFFRPMSILERCIHGAQILLQNKIA